MIIAHLSDTHIGYSGTGRQKLVPDIISPGIQVRQQEVDLMLGLRQAITEIIQRGPDLVIHTGDLFDMSSPSPRNIRFALEEFWRLSNADIPVILLEGDHSCPRSAKDGHALGLFERIPHVTVVYGEARSIQIGSVKVHALSHQELFRVGLPRQSARSGVDGHILATHCVADGHHFFKTGRSACIAPIGECANRYEYVALGHCHFFAQVPETAQAFYSGATAPVVPNDFSTATEWGFNLIDLSASSPRVEKVPIPTRPVKFYGLHDAAGLSADEIMQFVSKQAQEIPPDHSYCFVEIEEMDALARRELSVREVEEIFGQYSSFSLRIRLKEHKHQGDWQQEAFESRFDRLVQEVHGTDELRSDVSALGHRLLKSALQISSDDTVEADDNSSELQFS